MKRYALALLGLVTACSGGAAETSGALDASSDSTAPVEVDAGVDCSDAGSPPSSLACTGLYANFATKEISPSAQAYTPSSLLWSDGAQKARWIELPPNTKIDITNPDEWTFPVGTKLFKEFRVNGQRVETRMFQKQKTNFWVYATYAWSGDATTATINYGGSVPVGDDGGTWTIPTNDDCNECHRGRQDRILGFEQVGLGLPGATGLTLAQLAAQGLVTPAPTNVGLTIGDDGTGLNGIAMGWVHINCGVTCHNVNAAAAGNGAGMNLRLDPTQLNGAPPSSAWGIVSTTINVPCVSGEPRRRAANRPGRPGVERPSTGLIDERGTLQMPPIATNVVDTSDVAVIRSWIQAMGGSTGDDGGPPPADAGEDAGHHRDGGVLDGGERDGGERDGGEHDAGPDATLQDASPDADVDAGVDASEDAPSSEDATTSDASNAGDATRRLGERGRGDERGDSPAPHGN